MNDELDRPLARLCLVKIRTSSAQMQSRHFPRGIMPKCEVKSYARIDRTMRPETRAPHSCHSAPTALFILQTRHSELSKTLSPLAKGEKQSGNRKLLTAVCAQLSQHPVVKFVSARHCEAANARFDAASK